ncbi:MAG: protein kinase [Pirellulales bacterium]
MESAYRNGREPELADYADAAPAWRSVLEQHVSLLRTTPDGTIIDPRSDVRAQDGQTDPRSVQRSWSNVLFPSVPTNESSVDLSFLQPPSVPNAIGSLGHYDILEVIGHGGFGIVLKAFDRRLHRKVAVKVLNPQLATSKPSRMRFLREARAAAAVRNEYVIQVFSVEERPLPYFVMEFVEGSNLQQRIESQGAFSAQEILRVGLQVARGLAAAHSQGLIHRDVKPDNVLLDNRADLQVKITDFGLARSADDASLSNSGAVAGTPMYMSPEQAEGNEIDHRSDLFSLGSLLYTIGCGQPPFIGSTVATVLRRVVDTEPKSMRSISPSVPDWLEPIVLKLHKKRPEERFQSAQEVVDQLNRIRKELQQQATRAADEALTKSSSTVSPVETAESLTPSTASSTRKRGRSMVRIFLSIVIAVLAVAVGIVWRFKLLDEPMSEESTADKNAPSTQVTQDGSAETAVSPEKKDDASIAAFALMGGANIEREIKAREFPTEWTTWIEQVRRLPDDERLEAIVEKLTEVNPGFDGRIEWSQFDSGIGVAIHTPTLVDIFPLAALKNLMSVDIEDTKVSDLLPLSGANLIYLNIGGTPVEDLSPIRGMKLQSLYCADVHLTDISPLKGMPLRAIVLDYLPEHDAVLRSMTRLQTINGLRPAEFWAEPSP